MKQKTKKCIQYVLLLVGFLILLVLVANSGILSNLHLFLEINPFIYVIAILFVVLNIISKTYRWCYLSQVFDTTISWKSAFTVFFSSLFFGNITPAKVGDLYKAYYMKHRYSLGYVKGVSMIFYERFYELLILALIGGAAILFIEIDAGTQILMVGVIILLFILLLIFTKLHEILLFLQKHFKKIPFVSVDENGNVSLQKITAFQSFSVFAITFLALTFEFARIWFVALAFGVELPFIPLAIIYCLSIVVGLISQIPLGLGVMEGSLAFLMTLISSVSLSTATFIVLIDRVISMYLLILIGLIVSKISFNDLENVVQ